MFIRYFLASVIAIGAMSGFAPAPARAADALALEILGFSPDGRHFAFMQYGALADAGAFMAETYVIDAARDRYVPGVPVRVDAEVEDGDNDMSKGLKAIPAEGRKRAAAVLKRHNISRPGRLVARDEAARPAESDSGSEKPGVGGTELSGQHPRLGPVRLTLDVRQLPWSRGARLGAHPEATSCAEELDTPTGAAFRLTLRYGAKTVVLNDDKTIPVSRRCVTGYGLIEAHAFDRPDGKVTLAVVLGMAPRGFEGQDRVFLAVTRVIDP